MTVIGKTFTKEGEQFTVETTKTLTDLLICRSHVDKKLWVFSVEEVRKVLEKK